MSELQHTLRGLHEELHRAQRLDPEDRAMLETLPQLVGGCLNYWDAGNWALNPAAEPAGPKDPRIARVLHQRSPASREASRSDVAAGPACRSVSPWSSQPKNPVASAAPAT